MAGHQGNPDGTACQPPESCTISRNHLDNPVERMRGQAIAPIPWIYSVAMRSSLALLALLVILLVGCGGTQVYGHIPPSTFRFTTVVPHQGIGAGGWKVAQVLVLLGRISAIFPRGSTCQVEVGVPEVNFRGPISNSHAQIESARAADAAARTVLQKRLPSGLVCIRFRQHMRAVLRRAIRGAEVSEFMRQDVPHTTFPRKGRR